MGLPARSAIVALQALLQSRGGLRKRSRHFHMHLMGRIAPGLRAVKPGQDIYLAERS